MIGPLTAADVEAMGLVVDDKDCFVQHNPGMRPHRHIVSPSLAEPADERPLDENEVMRRLSADNPKSRHHREERFDGWSSWTCVPIRDVIEVRAALLADVARQEIVDALLELDKFATWSALNRPEYGRVRAAIDAYREVVRR